MVLRHPLQPAGRFAMTEAVVTGQGSVEMLVRTATKERKGDATASPNLTASDATAEHQCCMYLPVLNPLLERCRWRSYHGMCFYQPLSDSSDTYDMCIVFINTIYITRVYA
jgi:hypothetical protein